MNRVERRQRRLTAADGHYVPCTAAVRTLLYKFEQPTEPRAYIAINLTDQDRWRGFRL